MLRQISISNILIDPLGTNGVHTSAESARCEETFVAILHFVTSGGISKLSYQLGIIKIKSRATLNYINNYLLMSIDPLASS